MAIDNRYNDNTITIAIGDDDGDPAVVEALNDILETNARSRSLGGPLRKYGDRAVIPLADGADPFDVCDALRLGGTRADPRPELVFYSGTNQTVDPGFPPFGVLPVTDFGTPPVAGIGRDVGHLAGPGHPASIGRDVGHLVGPGHPEDIGRDVGHFAAVAHTPAFGCDVGHGLACAELGPDFKAPDPPEWKPLPSNLRRPVVALLDSGVGSHTSLPDDPADPFLSPHDWHSPLAEMDPATPKGSHGTFSAGLIHLNAPTARILSFRVMDGDGLVLESNVVRVLLWLEKYRRHNPLDVIVMPFGRSPGGEADNHALAHLHAPIARLAAAGVAIVASAGNDHQGAGIHPAAFDDVIGVGAGFGDYHANFSNYGDWVDRFREGVDALSTLPSDNPSAYQRWGRWSGTSFSAAVVAADLARPHAV